MLFSLCTCVCALICVSLYIDCVPIMSLLIIMILDFDIIAEPHGFLKLAYTTYSGSMEVFAEDKVSYSFFCCFPLFFCFSPSSCFFLSFYPSFLQFLVLFIHEKLCCFLYYFFEKIENKQIT